MTDRDMTVGVENRTVAGNCTANASASVITLLDAPVNNVSFAEAVERIVAMCRAGKPCYVVTPNVDHVMRLQKDERFREIYGKAALSLADGMPLIWAAKLLGTPLKAKVSGSDLFVELCRRSAEDHLRVFLLGAAPGVADKARDVLVARYPGLQIVGTLSPRLNSDGTSPDDEEIEKIVKAAKPHLLFLAFGAPKQEYWIARMHDYLQVPVTIGVGASFDFVAGTVRRAPRWMQKAGLEWFWRLMQEPRRLWRRYLVDDLPFVWRVMRRYMFKKCGGKGM
jgi:N-acetylglucosaminyldiphosphoundecaprenol N-acetyl-beta-D-mannosaminyltransferase